jgi:uncharacterized membrane protein
MKKSAQKEKRVMNFTHLHLMLNHVPVIALIFGCIVLAFGVVLRSKHVRGVGLALLVVSALTAIPVYLTGESAEEVVEGIQNVSGNLIEEHQSAAGVSLALAVVSGIFALIALVPFRARPDIGSNSLSVSGGGKSGTPQSGRSALLRLQGYMVLAALFVSLLASISMAWTANLGGQIRHTEISEFQSGSKDVPAKSHDNKRSEKDDD